jgi:hypothetical protein
LNARPGSLASYAIDRRRVYRLHLTPEQRVRALLHDYGPAAAIGLSVAGLLLVPALLMPVTVALALVLLVRVVVFPERWELECPHYEYEGGVVIRYAYRWLGLTTPWGKKVARVLGIPDPWQRGKGILFLGSNQDTAGKSVWISLVQACTHMLCFGATGSGKTQWMLGLLQQFIQMGSGGILVDGKADVVTWYLIYGICRMVGREDDLLVINMLTAGNSTTSKRRYKASNTSNILAVGSSDSLMELLSALMGEAGATDGMWRNRAEALGRAVLRGLVEKRDRGELILSVDVIRDYLPLDAVERLSREPLSEMALAGLHAYLRELPGWEASQAPPIPNPQGGPPQPNPAAASARAKASEQHGYLAMQFTAVLELLSGTYGHITRTDLSEVDWRDVIANRRIVYVMLPSMEKSPQGLKNLGRMAVTAIRSALVPMLGGDRLTGQRRFLADARPTNAEVPYLIALDEYGSYAVDGFGDVAAQARSLGICTVFAGQDYASFKRGSEIEAERIAANTSIKIFLKTESVGTAEEAIKRAGKQYTLLSGQGGSLKREAGLFSVGYQDQGSGSVHEIDRVSLLDLVAQKAGEAHILFGPHLWRVRTFYGDFVKPANAQVNHFVKIYRPDLAGPNVPAHVLAYRELRRFVSEIRPRLLKPPPERAPARPGTSETGMVAEMLDALRAESPPLDATSEALMVGVRPIARLVQSTGEPLFSVSPQENFEESFRDSAEQLVAELQAATARAALEAGRGDVQPLPVGAASWGTAPPPAGMAENDASHGRYETLVGGAASGALDVGGPGRTRIGPTGPQDKSCDRGAALGRGSPE